MVVSNNKTGEVLVEKKFYKAEFGDVWSNPDYSPYIDSLLESAMVRKMSNNDFLDVDPESYEEVRSISMEIGDDFMELET